MTAEKGHALDRGGVAVVSLSVGRDGTTWDSLVLSGTTLPVGREGTTWDSMWVTGRARTNGTTFLRNRLFLVVRALLPCIFTKYASCGSTSRTTPDFNHLLGFPLVE